MPDAVKRAYLFMALGFYANRSGPPEPPFAEDAKTKRRRDPPKPSPRRKYESIDGIDQAHLARKDCPDPCMLALLIRIVVKQTR